MGPVTWLSLQSPRVPTPQQEFPESSSGVPPLPFSPPPGSQGQEPPNYFQMWTQPRGGRGGGGGEMREKQQ